MLSRIGAAAIMLSLIVVITPSSGQAQNFSPKLTEDIPSTATLGKFVKWDLLGITLGITREEFRQKILSLSKDASFYESNNDSSYRDDRGQIISVSYPIKIAAHINRSDGSSEEIQSFYSSPAAGGRLAALTRVESLGSSTYDEKTFVDGVRAKFGEPTVVQDGSTMRFIVMDSGRVGPMENIKFIEKSSVDKDRYVTPTPWNCSISLNLAGNSVIPYGMSSKFFPSCVGALEIFYLTAPKGSVKIINYKLIDTARYKLDAALLHQQLQQEFEKRFGSRSVSQPRL